MRTGLKIPSSSSSSSGWHASFPGLSPDSTSPTLGPLPPFSRLQEPVLFRLLLVDPGPASPSNWFLEFWISLCRWNRRDPGRTFHCWALRGCVVIKCHQLVPNTSLMSMRPAMVSLVRGEKCGVIMMRKPASEKDSLWGLRMRSSSTMTTGGGSWLWAWPVKMSHLTPAASWQHDYQAELF